MRIQTHPAMESGADVSRTAAPPESGKPRLAPAPESGNASETVPHKPTIDEVNASVAKINASMQALLSSLEFSVDQDTKIDVVKVIDMKTKEVIRQFPTEEILTIAKAIDRFKGALLKETA